MSLNTIEPSYSNGQIIDASHTNELTASLLNQFVGRNSSGVPESGKSLGTAAIPWGPMHAASLILDGQVVDPSTITTLQNRIVSGKTRSDSKLPMFLKAHGSAATVTVEGATTELTLSINGTAVSVSTDIVKTGLTLAPSANNTCLVNDTTMSSDKYAGEDGSVITIDTLGSEVTAKVGQMVAFQINTEIFWGFLKSSTEIVNVFRGFFFDDAQAPIVREGLSDNDTLTLMNIAWVFIEDNGTTVDFSYRTPIYQYEAPASPATGDYWFDIPNQTWKRYSGTQWEIINRILTGMAILDDTNCIATRSMDFSLDFSDYNTVELEILTNERIQSKEMQSIASVYGTTIIQNLKPLDWDISSDLETGLSQAASTYYYLFLTEKGNRVLGTEKPYYRTDLKGYYHPYHSWRCMGEVYNDSSSDFTEERNYFMDANYNPSKEIPQTFSARIFNDSTASIISQGKYTFIESVTRSSAGVIDVVYKLGFFYNKNNKAPTVNATPEQISAWYTATGNHSVNGFSMETNDNNGTKGDRNQSITVTRQV